MDNDELLARINELTSMLRYYRSEQKKKKSSAQSTASGRILENFGLKLEENQIDEAVAGLIEAFVMGPNGNICPKCFGSGRV